MSGRDERSAMRARLKLVSSVDMDLPVMTGAGFTRAGVGASASPDAAPVDTASRTELSGQADDASHADRISRIDPSAMPGLSESQKQFMALMSGRMAGGEAVTDASGRAHLNCEDDPAFAVGIALFFWRFCRRGLPMPRRAMRLLERHAAAGDPACILVRDWLKKKMAGSPQRPMWVFEGGRQE